MRPLLLLLAALPLLPPAPAAAQDCAAEIAALYDGPLDPWQHPPHRAEFEVTDAAGNLVTMTDAVIVHPFLSLSAFRGSGQWSFATEDAFWVSPSAEGPWTRVEMAVPDGRREAGEKLHAEYKAGVTEPVCDGRIEEQGRALLRYSFRTQTPPDANGGHYGEADIVLIDAETGQLARWERRDMVAPWMPSTDGSVVVTRLMFDPGITLVPPDQP